MKDKEKGTFFAAAAAMTIGGNARDLAVAAAAAVTTVAGVVAQHRCDPRGSRDTKPAEKADADDAIASSSTATGSTIG